MAKLMKLFLGVPAEQLPFRYFSRMHASWEPRVIGADDTRALTIERDFAQFELEDEQGRKLTAAKRRIWKITRLYNMHGGYAGAGPSDQMGRSAVITPEEMNESDWFMLKREDVHNMPLQMAAGLVHAHMKTLRAVELASLASTRCAELRHTLGNV